MATTNEAYVSEPQQRILKLLLLLSGNEVVGLAPSEIAKEQGCTPSIVTRDLANLEHAGFAERIPETQRWRLAPLVVQISLRHSVAMDRAAKRLDEVRNRFSRM